MLLTAVGLGRAQADEIASSPLAVADPLAATAEMRAWSERHLGRTTADRLRLRRLHAALTGGGPRTIAEIPGPTPTAAEAFAGRRADCVGFALAFASLSRAVGIDTGFALTAVAEEETEHAGLRIARHHLVAVHDGWVFDFAGASRLDRRRHRPIADRAALALYHSNRGAQALVAGHPREAIELLYGALRFDPSLTWVWSNLGVALRRAGDPVGAVLANGMALRLDPFDPAAHRNLAAGESGAPTGPRAAAP